MKKISLVFCFLLSLSLSAQEELLELLEGGSEGSDFVFATFKSTRLINGHSVEMRTTGILEFIISHRFGRINRGGSELWGLDQSSIRLGLEYGLSDNLNIGLGRASFGKVFDAFLKYRTIRPAHRARSAERAMDS